MSRKGVDGFPRRRSASLKERFFLSRERKKNQSARARIQSTGTLKSCSDADLKGPLTIKYKFIKETSVRVYTLDNVSRNPWERLINNAKFPWCWDTHTIVLGDTEIYSPTAIGVFASPIPYVNIETWMAVSIPRLPFSYIKLCTSDASYLIQAPDTYQRDRLLHSVQWKRNICKYEKILYSATHADVIVNELQNLVKLTLAGPLYLDDTNSVLFSIVSNLLLQNQDQFDTASNESLITTLAPLFEENQPSIEICNFFTKHCRACPRSRVVIDMFMPVVLRILKYNTNYGKNVWLRGFVKEYIQALNMQNDGEAAVRAFVQTVHGPLSVCPHKRILNNLFAVCLSAIYDSFCPAGENTENKSAVLVDKNSPDESCLQYKNKNQSPVPAANDLWESFAKYSKNGNTSVNNNMINSADNISPKSPNYDYKENFNKDRDSADPEKAQGAQNVDTVILFAKVLDEISTISDWLPGLSILLQPVPFQSEAVKNADFVKYMVQIMERIIVSEHDDIVWCLVSLRDHKDGWLQIFSPQSSLYQDEGVLFTKMTAALLESAKRLNKVKKLVNIFVKSCLNAVLLLALRESDVMIEVLCFALEYKLTVGKQELQIVSTLRSTANGRSCYERLCEQEMVMRQKGGPHEFTLPPRSTDQDLHKFLNSGSCGNLKNLNLSFTYVSCKSADLISRLPALQHLNLWSSNIQDLGLRRLCESLNLKTLNLCETHVTDDGIKCLKDMTNLTSLNLNSTAVSDGTFQDLKESLKNLAHCDVTYTEAWPQCEENPSNSPNNNSSGVAVQPKKLEYKQNI